MLHSHCNHHHHHHLLLLTQHHYSPLSHSSPYLLHFLHKPIIRTIHHHSVAAIPPAASLPWLTHLAQLNSSSNITGEDLNSIFVPISDPFILMVSSAVILTTIITAVFRSNRRRAKRAHELKLRYAESKNSLDSLKGMGSISSIKTKSKRRKHRPDEALLGAVISAAVAYFLIKFTVSMDADFSRQALSHNFSVRQFTITLRTIIIDMCYLAIFIYGFSSIGLLLYSGELAFNNMSMGRPSGKGTRSSKITEESHLSHPSNVESLTCSNEMASTKEDQSSKNSP